MDPERGVLYLTEDNFGFPSGLYRYTSEAQPDAGRAARATAAGWRCWPSAACRTPTWPRPSPRARPTGSRWVGIDDPAPTFPFTPGPTAPTTNDQAINHVGNQGRAQGAAWFSRLEGATYDRGVIYFCSTQGGGPAEPGPSDTVGGFGNGTGQIWGYDIASGRLRLIFQSPGADVLDFPDNVTVSKRGTLVLCEDNVNDNYVRGLSPEGELWDIALNRLISSTGANRFNDEFAGATFSPDRPHAVRQHPGQPGHDVRHLGSLGLDRRVTRHIPVRGWKDLAARVREQMKADDVPLLAAGVAFYALLSLVPALVVLVSVYGLIADPEGIENDIEDSWPRRRRRSRTW